jgi:hypothetical protein
MSDREAAIHYIDMNINKLEHEDKIQLLSLLFSSGVDASTMKEKGAGLQIQFSSLSDEKLQYVSSFINSRLDAVRKEFSKSLQQ